MKKHRVVGMSLLLTLGTAVAGTLMYGSNSAADQYAQARDWAMSWPGCAAAVGG